MAPNSAARVLELVEQKLSYTEIAEQLGMKVHSVRARLSEARKAQAEPAALPPEARVMQFPSEEVREVPPSAPPAEGERFDLYPIYEATTCIIAGDIHAVTHNDKLLTRMVDFARLHNVKHFFCVGDIWNGDADSSHDSLGDEVSRAAEFEVVADIMHYLLSVFSTVVLTPGNHLRKRFTKTLRQDIHPEQMVRLITRGDDDTKVTMLKHDMVCIWSGRHKWIATHQYQYRQAKLSIGNELAQKFASNIITLHQHHTAIGRDKYDRYTIIDVGGLHDHRRMAYVHLVPSTRNVPNNGFVYLEEGTAHLLTPYDTMTSWRRWGFEPMEGK